jgi:hypothetical protein
MRNVQQIQVRMRKARELVIFYAKYSPDWIEDLQFFPVKEVRSALQDPNFADLAKSIGRKYRASLPTDEDCAFWEVFFQLALLYAFRWALGRDSK